MCMRHTGIGRAHIARIWVTLDDFVRPGAKEACGGVARVTMLAEAAHRVAGNILSTRTVGAGRDRACLDCVNLVILACVGPAVDCCCGPVTFRARGGGARVQKTRFRWAASHFPRRSIRRRSRVDDGGRGELACCSARHRGARFAWTSCGGGERAGAVRVTVFERERRVMVFVQRHAMSFVVNGGDFGEVIVRTWVCSARDGLVAPHTCRALGFLASVSVPGEATRRTTRYKSSQGTPSVQR